MAAAQEATKHAAGALTNPKIKGMLERFRAEGPSVLAEYANDPDVAGIMQTLSQAKANIIPPASVAESASFSIGGSSGGGGLPIRLETKGLRQRKPAQEEALLVPPTEIVDSDDAPTSAAAIHRRRQHMASKKAVEESSHFKHEELEEEFGDGNVVTSHSPFWATPAQAIASALGGLGAKSKHHSSSNEGGGDANIQGGVSQILADVLGLGGSSGSKNANADGAEDNDDNEVVANLASFPPRSGSAYDMMMQLDGAALDEIASRGLGRDSYHGGNSDATPLHAVVVGAPVDPSYDASYLNALREAAGTTWDEDEEVKDDDGSDSDLEDSSEEREEEGSVGMDLPPPPPSTSSATASADRLSNSHSSSTGRRRRNRHPHVLIGVGAGPLCGLLAKVIANCLARNCRIKVLLGRGSERFLALASRADPLGWAALEVACSRNRNHTGRSRAKVQFFRAEDDDLPWSNLDGSHLDSLMNAAGGVSAEGTQQDKDVEDRKKRGSRKNREEDSEFKNDNDDDDNASDNSSDDNNDDDDSDDDDDDDGSCALLPSGAVGGDDCLAKPVDWSNSWRGWPAPLHAKLASWADAFLVLPLDVSTLGAVASGYASEPGPVGCLVTRTLRAWPASSSSTAAATAASNASESNKSGSGNGGVDSLDNATKSATHSSSTSESWISSIDHDEGDTGAVRGKPLLIGLGLALWEAKSPATAGQLAQLVHFWPQLDYLSAAKGASLDPRTSTKARAKAVSCELIRAAGGDWSTKQGSGSRQRSAQRRTTGSSSGSRGENGWLGSPKGASEKEDESSGGIRRRK